MLKLSKDLNVYIYGLPVDMRSSFDSLSMLVGEQATSSNSLFVFFAKQKKKVKILYWDNDGFALWYKRLEAGTFKFSSQSNQIVSGVDLRLLLSGMEFSRIKIRKKFSKK